MKKKITFELAEEIRKDFLHLTRNSYELIMVESFKRIGKHQVKSHSRLKGVKVILQEKYGVSRHVISDLIKLKTYKP